MSAASEIAQGVEGVESVKNDLQVGGVVTLTGQVPTIGASAKASELARGVPGVKSVKNGRAGVP